VIEVRAKVQNSSELCRAHGLPSRAEDPWLDKPLLAPDLRRLQDSTQTKAVAARKRELGKQHTSAIIATFANIKKSVKIFWPERKQ
jgi:hypothetical protein